MVGAIVGDFFFKQGEPGIGVLIDNYRSRLRAPELFASIVLASLRALSSPVSSAGLSNRVVDRWYRNNPPDTPPRFLTGHLFPAQAIWETWPSAHCTGVSRYVGMAAIAATVAAATVACSSDDSSAGSATPAPSARSTCPRCAPPRSSCRPTGHPSEHGHLYQLLGPDAKIDAGAKKVVGPLFWR